MSTPTPPWGLGAGAGVGAGDPMATISGGAKLEAALKKIAANLSKAQTLRVGFLEGRTYPDGTSVPMVAAVNEFGAPSRGQPPRPFFRRMIAKNSGDWPDAIEAALKTTNYDAQKSLGLVGVQIVAELQQSIIDFTDPPLAASTIKRKGSSTALVDTGLMLRSVDSEVE